MFKTVIAALSASVINTTVANAEPRSLQDYLHEMDRTAVTFSGKIVNSSNGFALSTDVGYFFVNIDTGREQREFVEDNCRESWGDGPICLASGTATVEIDGGGIELSINLFEILRQVDNE